MFKETVLLSGCWFKNKKAQGMVEYALLLAFVAVLALVAALVGDSALKNAVLDTFADVLAKVQLVIGA
ncbi:MAG: pilin protein [Anaerovibrio sp.]|nr:pilin protein [Anaerovibrio sp.]